MVAVTWPTPYDQLQRWRTERQTNGIKLNGFGHLDLEDPKILLLHESNHTIYSISEVNTLCQAQKQNQFVYGHEKTNRTETNHGTKTLLTGVSDDEQFEEMMIVLPSHCAALSFLVKSYLAAQPSSPCLSLCPFPCDLNVMDKLVHQSSTVEKGGSSSLLNPEHPLL